MFVPDKGWNLGLFPVPGKLVRVCVTCVNSVLSMQPQCLHSLHPVASPLSGSSRDAKCLILAIIYFMPGCRVVN